MSGVAVRYDAEADVVRSTWTEPVTAAALDFETRQLVKLAEEHGCPRLLSDYSTTSLELTIIDVYRDVREQAAWQVDRTTAKIAVVTPADGSGDELADFYDALALVSGWNARVFDHATQAITWLKR